MQTALATLKSTQRGPWTSVMVSSALYTFRAHSLKPTIRLGHSGINESFKQRSTISPPMINLCVMMSFWGYLAIFVLWRWSRKYYHNVVTTAVLRCQWTQVRGSWAESLHPSSDWASQDIQMRKQHSPSVSHLFFATCTRQPNLCSANHPKGMVSESYYEAVTWIYAQVHILKKSNWNCGSSLSNWFR